MIVPMKKFTLITLSKEAGEVVLALRKLGVVHIEHPKPPKGEDIRVLQDDIAVVKSAISVLPVSAASQKEPQDWRFLTGHITDLKKRLEHLENYAQTLKSNIILWERWGDFDPQDFKELTLSGLFIGLYQIPKKELSLIPTHIIVKEIFSIEGLSHCLLISRNKIEVSYKQISLPKMSLSQMRQRLQEDRLVMEDIGKELTQHACYFVGLKKALLKLEKSLEFSEVVSGLGQEEDLVYSKGFIPRGSEQAIEALAARHHWGIVIEEPSEEDTVPTLLRNPAWVNLIRPVFKLLAIIPGYRDLDISPLFLLFLSLFFGMIIGDAGYGMVYFLLTFFLQKKLSHKIEDKKVFFLFYLFSAWAVFWGLLTGTCFGQEWFLSAGHKPFIPILNDTKFLQAFCFFLGAFHLSLGHIWQGIRKAPSWAALADAGWVCVLWSAFFVAKTLILNDPYPNFVNWLIAVGVTLVIFFSKPQKNILKAFLQGLGTVLLSLMSNFTDVVSYVRLFAVGLAGVAISDTVNALAQSVGGNVFTRLIILFIGHAINIILGTMSVLVHGIRLNVLEFSSHAKLTWSGVPYKPFKE